MNDSALRITPREFASIQNSAAVAIDIRDLDFYYGKSHALKDVTLAVPANCVTAIIGPSGCGKSTLLRAINRIYEIYPDQYAAGSIAIDGRNVLDRMFGEAAHLTDECAEAFDILVEGFERVTAKLLHVLCSDQPYRPVM